jgi:predicted phosphoadenosine phosphosulfate sulfurtransferase
VPSYKSIAIAILKNDLMLRGLGFGEEEGALAKYLRTIRNARLKQEIEHG